LVKDSKDGTFWMSFDDFKDYFSKLYICKYKESYRFTSKRVQASFNEFFLFQLNVDYDGICTIGLS
jgi:hypothetical protein